MPFLLVLALFVTRCDSLSFVATRCAIRCHSLSLIFICCHSLSFLVTHCHSLSLDVPLVCLYINDRKTNRKITNAVLIAVVITVFLTAITSILNHNNPTDKFLPWGKPKNINVHTLFTHSNLWILNIIVSMPFWCFWIFRSKNNSMVSRGMKNYLLLYAKGIGKHKYSEVVDFLLLRRKWVCKIAWHSYHACMPGLRDHVSKACQLLIFTHQRTNKRANVPKAYQLFNLASHRVKEVPIFQLRLPKSGPIFQLFFKRIFLYLNFSIMLNIC